MINDLTATDFKVKGLPGSEGIYTLGCISALRIDIHASDALNSRISYGSEIDPYIT